MHSDAIAQGKEATLNKLQYVWGWILRLPNGCWKNEKSPSTTIPTDVLLEFFKEERS
jgi:hypothetical protein